ncbi:MAG TPA: type II toxin-antitoxin system VapC family toxin [Pyrinomonadaceae bacterium]|nr:type II toxin-antitoxin system VapC family toxin [Pyrinomonadaceae bacterium]
MALYFFDTSALVKRYALEDGRIWVQAVTAPAAGNPIYIARIAGAETVAAFMKKVRDRKIAVADVAKFISDFRLDFANQYQIIEITDAVVTRAMVLIESHKLRGYDGVQLAAALELNDLVLSSGMPAVGVSALTLVSADDELNQAALSEGLLVEDPRARVAPDDLTP